MHAFVFIVAQPYPPAPPPDTMNSPMPLLQTLRFIAGHPFNRGREWRSVADFVRWQIESRLAPGDRVRDWVDGARIIVRRGETGLTGNLYCGLHEFADMAYVLHVAGPDDLFVDIGANVGSYTVLACAARGAAGVSIEPVPATFARLLGNLRVNHVQDRVLALNIGLADADGELLFTTDENCVNHVLAEGETQAGALRVPVRALDAVLAGRAPSMMKIDVEGFETRVLQGGLATLRGPALHTVIMELNGSGARYGFDEREILALMRDCGFETYTYEPHARRLQPLDGKNLHSGNTLFIRDVARVQERIARAAPTRVMGRAL